MILDFIHSNFHLNGRQFSSNRELIDFSESLEDKSISLFLAEWFTVNQYIIVHTSGSTGKPKPIKIGKQFMINSALATASYLELPNKTTVLLALSVDYIAGKMMLIRAIINGWKMDVVNPSSNPLNGNTKKYDFTALVPLQVQNSLSQLENIKKVLIGGGVVSTKLLEDLQQIKSICYASYGMTETVTHIAIKQLNGDNKSANYHTLPNVQIDKDERGCLIIDAPKVALEKVITNDLVEISSKNEFQWLGRIDNVINSGGIKLIPEQIEEKLSKIIKQAFFVSGKPDVVLGEKLLLVIEGKKENDLNRKINNLNFLNKYQKPKAIYYINDFVYTETKKVNRKATLLKLKY